MWKCSFLGAKVLYDSILHSFYLTIHMFINIIIYDPRSNNIRLSFPSLSHILNIIAYDRKYYDRSHNKRSQIL